MENEELLNLVVNHAADIEKRMRQMRAKYVFDTREGPLQELFNKDAADWAKWKKIGAV